jgi:stearoyl-CoA desaturase (delta-9 desaturase)
MSVEVILLVCFFFLHWFSSLFCQTFFLHRYSAHQMFTMNKFWERFFYLLTFFAQGTSFLNPRAYAYLHRRHHAFSDTEKDPHSPMVYKSIMKMMVQTAKLYDGYLTHNIELTDETKGYVPTWDLLDKIGNGWIVRFAWVGVYLTIYLTLLPADYWWVIFITVPVHSLMGPIHGAIVNWCGHKYGYSNFDNKDNSKNSLIIDFLMMGELYQNNHHSKPLSMNFAHKWYEIDFTYWISKVLSSIGIIRMAKA